MTRPLAVVSSASPGFTTMRSSRGWRFMGMRLPFFGRVSTLVGRVLTIRATPGTWQPGRVTSSRPLGRGGARVGAAGDSARDATGERADADVLEGQLGGVAVGDVPDRHVVDRTGVG